MSLPKFNAKRYPELCSIVGDQSLDHGKRSLVDEAYDRILLQIISGDLPPGSELKSTRLAEAMGMSRTPIIQALARLTADGIVKQMLNLRAEVRPGAENWLLDLHQTRQLLEPAAIRVATGRVPQHVLADLQMLVQDVNTEIISDWQTGARWLDQALHLVVAEYCGNLAMCEFLRRCWGYKRLSYEAGKDSESHLREGHKQHAAIIEAMTRNDAEAASRLMAEHLQAASLQKTGERIV
jgi:DNA-binding GntR family transcriptional regulator